MSLLCICDQKTVKLCNYVTKSHKFFLFVFANIVVASTCSSRASLLVEVAHIVGAHKTEIFTEKMEITSFELNVYILPPDMLIKLSTLPELTPHSLFHYK